MSLENIVADKSLFSCSLLDFPVPSAFFLSALLRRHSLSSLFPLPSSLPLSGSLSVTNLY